jgi:hypothetical protein
VYGRWLREERPPVTQPLQIHELRDVTGIACTPSGYYHGRGRVEGFSCAAVDAKGALYTWGVNSRGQLLHPHRPPSAAAPDATVVDRPRRTERFDGSWRCERVLQVAMSSRPCLRIRMWAVRAVGTSPHRADGTAAASAGVSMASMDKYG